MSRQMSRTSGIPDTSVSNQLVTDRYLICCEPMRRLPCATLTRATAAAKARRANRNMAPGRWWWTYRACCCKSVIKPQPGISGIKKHFISQVQYNAEICLEKQSKLIFRSRTRGRGRTRHHIQVQEDYGGYV